MEKEEKLKNLKDLEYSRWLNLENIIFALIGGAIIAVILTKPEDLPADLNKSQMLFFLISSIFATIFIVSKKLEQILDAIKKI